MSSKKDRTYYEKLFEPYNDVVSLDTMRIMLGGIGKNNARHLLQHGYCKGFQAVRPNGRKLEWCIPKEYLIDYVLSPHYEVFKETVSAQI